MTLRWRISAALLVLTAGAVVFGTWLHLLEVSRQLEGTLERQASRLVSALEAELEQASAILDEELALTLRRGGLYDRWSQTPTQGRVLAARGRIERGRLEILKILDGEGQILVSGHWPSSFGAKDPAFATYQEESGAATTLVDEATPLGVTPALERWTWVRGDQLVVVSGRFLDMDALERMRVTIGADLLALCRASADAGRASPCAVVGSDEAMIGMPFDVADPFWHERYLLAPVPVGGTMASSLIVGLDRKPIDRVQQGIVRRAIVVGAVSVVLAVIIGFLLARRVVKPIEALALAAERVAEGELHARVDVDGGPAGREVTRLVDTFNQMAADVARSQIELRQAERVAAWREIARGLAHELKNPLTPIRGAMDVIRRAHRLGRADFGDILDEQASAVEEEVLRLKELADAFARFARLPDPSPEELDLRAIVDKTLALYVPDGGDVVVARDYDAAVPAVWADKTQLGTALTNLIKNAVEAMEGRGRLTVRVKGRPSQTPPVVELSIEDSGPGLAREVTDRLFTPYVTTKGSRGTGLGLAMVHRIVMEHRGSIDVGRGVDGGARFTLVLPVDALKPHDAGASDPADA